MILPVVLFVGIGTVLRMGEANYHDVVCIAGMNRIRAGYLELAPELERFFVMGTHDDERGIAKTMAVDPQLPSWSDGRFMPCTHAVRSLATGRASSRSFRRRRRAARNHTGWRRSSTRRQP